MARRLTLPLIALSLVCQTGCPSSETVPSDEVKEKELVRRYSVRYDAGAQQLEFIAQFRVDDFQGATVQLNHPSYVTVDGDEMRLRHGDDKFFNVSGTDYYLSRSVDQLQKSYTFHWHKKDGSEETEVVKIPQSPGLNLKSRKPTTLRRDKTNRWPLRNPLNKNETGAATIGTPSDPALVHGSVENRTHVVFKRKDVRPLWLGEAQLTLTRTRRTFGENGEGKRVLEKVINHVNPVTVEIVEPD